MTWSTAFEANVRDRINEMWRGNEYKIYEKLESILRNVAYETAMELADGKRMDVLHRLGINATEIQKFTSKK